ncbi:hypothetical protein CBR_g37067 [Chara braunii]|uniref:Glucan endo-1,3-beta-D-glucosidase n=1 Tax=Chara braunii TaxID=69332 RepID=A0A388LM90_CHABU|nr:hypothetical protein CBR_g37067 [Chara braunii]|eukprot:GBG83353.1 hypothetical protein CBR_g37067 [Chara braunii]
MTMLRRSGGSESGRCLRPFLLPRWLAVDLSFISEQSSRSLGQVDRHMISLFLSGTMLAAMMLMSTCVEPGHAAQHGAGFNFGIDLSSRPLPFDRVVETLQTSKANAVKIFRHNAKFLQAVSGVDIHVVAGIANEQIPILANDYEAAKGYISDNIKPFVPATKIKIIVVGNEANEPYALKFLPQLVAAMRHVHRAVQHFGLQEQIKVTHPFSFGIMGTSYPPSAGAFQDKHKPMLGELLQFLADTGSPFMINIYPFLTVAQNAEIPLSYALYQATPEQHQEDGQHKYTNLMDAMVDSTLAAMEREGFPNLHLEVGEVGWPTGGHALATVENARLFNTGLVKHILSKKGTPRRPGWMQMYIFALLDEDQKSTDIGPFEPFWGVYTMEGVPKYPLDLTSS